jgi:hypothetical protein
MEPDARERHVVIAAARRSCSDEDLRSSFASPSRFSNSNPRQFQRAECHPAASRRCAPLAAHSFTLSSASGEPYTLHTTWDVADDSENGKCMRRQRRLQGALHLGRHKSRRVIGWRESR